LEMGASKEVIKMSISLGKLQAIWILAFLLDLCDCYTWSVNLLLH
jgi:hypothetical protein